MGNLLRQYHIKLADKESEENLRAVLFGYDRILAELITHVEKVDPDFDPPANYIQQYHLDEDQDGEILIHLLHHNKDSFETNAKWMKQWLDENVYEVLPEAAAKMTNAYLKSLEDAHNI